MEMIACVGAGPVFSQKDILALFGYDVTIYSKNEKLVVFEDTESPFQQITPGSCWLDIKQPENPKIFGAE